VAKVLNSAGFYTEPNASNVAVSLLAAVINNDAQSPNYLTADLSGVYVNPDPRTYPLSSYSYMMIPTALAGSFTEDKGLTLADFASYFLCEGQQQAEVLGYSPLPINLASAGLEQILKIPGGNPINKTIASCNNPTFSADGTNQVANNAPQPAACDKRGQDQCATGTGGAASTATAVSAGTVGGPVVGGSKSTNSPTGAPELPTLNGEAVGLSGGGASVVAGSPIDLPQRGIPITTLMLMLLAVVAALLAALLPPVVARRRAAAIAGAPRAPTSPKQRPTRPPALGQKKPWAALIPKVHLRVPFRKGGSAEPPLGDS
jgi:phosphate transport system substrate-binding protein